MFDIIPYSPEFDSVLATATLAGCDISPVIECNRFIGIGSLGGKRIIFCILDVKETPYVAEPHVIWLPWIPPKERMKAFKWAMQYYGSTKQVLLIVLKANNSLFEHFTKKRFLRKIGIIDHLPEEAGGEIHMYQYTREK